MLVSRRGLPNQCLHRGVQKHSLFALWRGNGRPSSKPFNGITLGLYPAVLKMLAALGFSLAPLGPRRSATSPPSGDPAANARREAADPPGSPPSWS